MPKPSKAHADRYPIFDQKLFPSQSNSGPITRRFAVCLGAASLATVLFCGVSTKRLRLFPAVPETSMRPIFTDGYHERWMKSLEPEIRVEQKSINDFDALLKGNYIKALHQYYEKTKEPIYMDTDISMDGNRVSYDLQRLTLYQHDLKQNSKVALKIETDEKGLYGKGTLECFFMHNHRTGETSPIEFFFYKEGVHQYPPELPENGYRISEQKFEAELSRMLNEMRTATQNGNFVGASMPNKSNSNLRDMLDEMQKNVSYAKTGQGRSFGLNYIEGWKP